MKTWQTWLLVTNAVLLVVVASVLGWTISRMQQIEQLVVQGDERLERTILDMHIKLRGRMADQEIWNARHYQRSDGID